MTTRPPIEGTCPDCNAVILELPDDTGITQFFEELPTRIVDQPDRLVWLGGRGVWPLPQHGPQPISCLRRHQCNLVNASESPSPPPAPPPVLTRAERADYTALRILRTQFELYRAQQLGRLRVHPGSRTYDQVSPTSRQTAIGDLTANRCALCRRVFASGESPLVVGHVDGASAEPVRVCTPECRRDNH